MYGLCRKIYQVLDNQGVGDHPQDLPRKTNEDLARRLEEALKTAEDEREKATTTLNKVQNVARLLQRSNDDLKLDLQKASAQNKNLMKERDALAADRKKLADEHKFLGEEVCNERFKGFEQGIAQCHYFFQVPLDYPEYDVMKEVVDGQLVTMSLPNDVGVPTPIDPSTAEAPQPVAVIKVGDEEAEVEA